MSAPSLIERVKTSLVALKMPRALEVLDVTLRGTSMTAPVASGWSVRRVGLSPTGKRRLRTAHANSGRSSDSVANRSNRPTGDVRLRERVVGRM
jgi:hypothetical protein